VEPGLSIQIAWPLAAQEAIIADSKFIEPAHLFLAVLKFAELEERQIEQVVANPAFTGPLLSERDDIRTRLHEHSVVVPSASRDIRHRLRNLFGKGGHPYDGQQVMHRSHVSREICRNAEDIARSANSLQWCALHLLDALLQSSAREVRDILAEAGISGPRAAETPCLDRYGRNISAMAAERQRGNALGKEPAPATDPVCKVVIEDILRNQRNSVLLIQTGKRSPREIVESIAERFASDSGPVRARRIIEIEISMGAWRTKSTSPVELESRMRAMFLEATEARNVVLFLSEFHRYLEPATGANYSDMLVELLSKGRVPCVGGVDAEHYHSYVEKDHKWRKLIRPVWIHDLDVPSQL
jgi:ATP-dependent Clp protease ATP-binding subunit ClpA